MTDDDKLDSSSVDNMYQSDNVDGPTSPTFELVQYRTYRSRWYILACFATMCLHQVSTLPKYFFK